MHQRSERDYAKEFDEQDRRGLKQVFQDLRDEATDLVRQEVFLAKTELMEKATKAGKNTGVLAAGALVAYTGLIFILLAGSILVSFGLEAAGLGPAWSTWLGPAIVGLAVVLAGWGMFSKGKKTLTAESLALENTQASLREDKEWTKRKVEDL